MSSEVKVCREIEACNWLGGVRCLFVSCCLLKGATRLIEPATESGKWLPVRTFRISCQGLVKVVEDPAVLVTGKGLIPVRPLKVALDLIPS